MANSRSYPSQVHERQDEREHAQFRDAYGSLFNENSCLEETSGAKGPGSQLHEMPTSAINNSNAKENFLNFELQNINLNTEEILEELISKLKQQRAKKERGLENRFGVTGLTEGDIPSWIPHSSHAGGSLCKDRPPDKQHFISNLEQIRESPDESRERSHNGFGRLDRNVTVRPEVRDEGIIFNQGSSSDQRKRSPERISRRDMDEQEGIKFDESVRSPVKTDTRSPTTRERRSPDLSGYNTMKNIDIMSYSDLERECDRQFQRLLEDTGDDNNCVAEGKLEKSEVHQVGPEVTTIPSSETTSTTDSSQADTVHSSLTYEGVKVVVKVRDISKKKKSKSPIKSVKDQDAQTSLQDGSAKSTSLNSNEVHSSSTSYMSPPSKLSPLQNSLLRSILTRLEVKNRNPKLHNYIKRLLSMTRESVENLPVSSVSDVSINSSIFEMPEQLPKPENPDRKLDVSCQAGSSLDDSCQDEVLKFSELAKCYADRVKDLAGMLDGLNLLPTGSRPPCNDDTSYLSPPDSIQQSVRLSNSVQAGLYPRPADISDIPTSIQPHPSHIQRPISVKYGYPRKISNELKAPDLSTILEAESAIEKGRVDPSKVFDPDVSSIRGTPQKKRTRESTCDSAASSLGLIDEKEISFILGSSSDDFEEVFRSLGISWALPTVRKTRESRMLSSSSSERGPYSHSTPLGLSPVKVSPTKSGPSSSKQKSSVESNKIAETDSLTPPSYSLNFRHLS